MKQTVYRCFTYKLLKEKLRIRDENFSKYIDVPITLEGNDFERRKQMKKIAIESLESRGFKLLAKTGYVKGVVILSNDMKTDL